MVAGTVLHVLHPVVAGTVLQAPCCMGCYGYFAQRSQLIRELLHCGGRHRVAGTVLHRVAVPCCSCIVVAGTVLAPDSPDWAADSRIGCELAHVGFEAAQKAEHELRFFARFIFVVVEIGFKKRVVAGFERAIFAHVAERHAPIAEFPFFDAPS